MSTTRSVLAHVLLFLTCLFICLVLMAFASSLAQSTQEDTAKLKQWSDSHEKLDNERYKRIESLEGTAAINKEKIARTDEIVKALATRMDELVWWLRLVVGGVALQLIGLAFRTVAYIRNPQIRGGR